MHLQNFHHQEYFEQSYRPKKMVTNWIRGVLIERDPHV